jgi:uncharacterized protein YdhG (YjbR/CyaY superfamily)
VPEKRLPSKSIDEYILRFPDGVQKKLRRIRAVIRAAAPRAEETISYRIPTFVLHGNLVHFAAFADHISFFPTSSGIRRFQKEISEYTWAKGTVRFPLDRPIPYDLIRRIVLFRVEENQQRKEKKVRAAGTSSVRGLPRGGKTNTKKVKGGL